MQPREDLWNDPAFRLLRERYHNIRSDIAELRLRLGEVERQVAPMSELVPELRALVRDRDKAAGRESEQQQRGRLFDSWWARLAALGVLGLQIAQFVFLVRGR